MQPCAPPANNWGLTQPAAVGTRFIVDLDSGKPTVRLEHELRVIDALGGELQLGGLPAAVQVDQAGQVNAADKAALNFDAEAPGG